MTTACSAIWAADSRRVWRKNGWKTWALPGSRFRICRRIARRTRSTAICFCRFSPNTPPAKRKRRRFKPPRIRWLLTRFIAKASRSRRKRLRCEFFPRMPFSGNPSRAISIAGARRSAAAWRVGRGRQTHRRGQEGRRTSLVEHDRAGPVAENRRRVHEALSVHQGELLAQRQRRLAQQNLDRSAGGPFELGCAVANDAGIYLRSQTKEIDCALQFAATQSVQRGSQRPRRVLDRYLRVSDGFGLQYAAGQKGRRAKKL